MGAKKSGRWRTLVEMWGREAGEECYSDGRDVYVPTNIVKFTQGRKIVWWTIKVPVEVAECYDDMFEKVV